MVQPSLAKTGDIMSKNLNTYHVMVQQFINYYIFFNFAHLNTYHVMVQPKPT